MDMKKWFKEEAKFGMMIHWGLYSLLAGEYKGQRTDDQGEWAQNLFRIPNEEYSKLAKAFNPIYFDADEWVLLAKEAGMNYIVITTKHHDGFCLFDSEYDDFNCVKGSPFGRDVIAELADACRRHGMKLGLYYSQEVDWHEPNGGGYMKSGEYNRGARWTNTWDFPDDEVKDFSQFFETKVLTQVREILTKYGDICLLWFDMDSVITYEQCVQLRELVKTLQPNCLINGRLGKNLGDYITLLDNDIPEKDISDMVEETPNAWGFSHCDNKSEILAETPITLNDTWGFKYFDDNWKSADKVIEIKERANRHGVNFLLNVGPDHLGRIPVPTIEILKEVGRKSKG